MKWLKKGHIFKPDNNFAWMQAYAQIPIVDQVSEDTLRIYFGTRDSLNRTYTAFIEVDAANPSLIKYIHDKPVIGPGELGSFDDCGAMPSCIVNHNGLKYLYYIGWNITATVPYHLSIGLAVSEDNGRSFTKMFKGPVMDRIHNEPFFCTVPSVTFAEGLWRMLYSSCTGWQIFADKPEPFYHIKYAESKDGIYWQREGKVILDYQDANEAGLVRPSVIKVGNQYLMWFSCRKLQNYRTDKNAAYRLGFARSNDGINWVRNDAEAGITVSEAGWDSFMISYPFIYHYREKIFMIYNGNGFGRTGFGYAVLEV